MSEFDENPKVILDSVKNLLIEGVKNRKHPFHTPIFSNITNMNIPDSRVVVLRKFDQDSLKLNFHTDYRSPKVTNLKKFNKSIFVFYDPEIKIQLRIKTISIINNQNNISKIEWENTRLFSRKCYLTQDAPSSKTLLPKDGISIKFKGIDPTKIESEAGYKNFTVIENLIQEIDWLHLAFSGHRRLNINLENSNILFDWLIP